MHRVGIISSIHLFFRLHNSEPYNPRNLLQGSNALNLHVRIKRQRLNSNTPSYVSHTQRLKKKARGEGTYVLQGLTSPQYCI